ISAIHFLHTLRIVHRDIKPDNLLLGIDGHLVIADLGIAHIFRETSTDNPHVITGEQGTPIYAAPEVFAGGKYSYGVDYYSMGIVYHHMLTG
ncbi:kinase-like domain-containing protein, partial [Panaeolus papilionaceus]